MVDDMEEDMYKLFSSKTRLEILKSLLEGERISADLARSMGKDRSTIKKHLDLLFKEALVERVEGNGKKWVFYRLTSKARHLPGLRSLLLCNENMLF